MTLEADRWPPHEETHMYLGICTYVTIPTHITRASARAHTQTHSYYMTLNRFIPRVLSQVFLAVLSGEQLTMSGDMLVSTKESTTGM